LTDFANLNMNNLAKFLIIFSIAFATFSAYQTAMGYSEISLIIAWVLASFTSVFFVLLNRAIVVNRKLGVSNFKVFIFYFVVLAISFGGNFVSFYSNVVYHRVFQDLLNEQKNSIIELKQNTEAYVENIDADLERKENLLLQQINRKGFEGCGVECRRIVDRINRQLDSTYSNVRIDIDKYASSQNANDVSSYFSDQFDRISQLLVGDIKGELNRDSIHWLFLFLF